MYGISTPSYHGHVNGLYYTEPVSQWHLERRYLPQLELSVHTHIVGSSSRTILTQKYCNPSLERSIPELRYTFPLYDGVSVVGFTCTINESRVIRGIVKERSQARKEYKAAVDRGETAGLLEQLPEASDVFTTTVGNVPAGASLKVEIIYLGELKNDAGVDGIRYTIPTSVAPRYGDFPGTLLDAPPAVNKSGIQITVDVETPNGSNIKSIQSPSHPISVTVGNTSAGAAAGTDMSLQKASATLALGTAELGQDFILQVVATNSGNPIALLETHPDIPQQRALMATLVPKFNLPSSRPEIVFVCDRSGSMEGTRIEGLKSALRIFLKSIPVGAKFNICSFGSTYDFLFKDGSRSYDQESLGLAMDCADRMDASYGGTEMYQPLEATFEKRYKDMDLEVFLLTDGEIWDSERLFKMVNNKVSESQGAIRLFTLGIGNDVSHALIEGVARAGNGFAQSVADNEKMNAKVIRMLKAGLSPHINDYTLEVKYDKDSDARAKTTNADEDFEIVEKVTDSLAVHLALNDKPSDVADKPKEPVKPISLFDTSADPDTEMPDAKADTSSDGKYSHVPSVPEPKILQSPFTIPALYPFIRSTVYLLLSPGTTQKTPKSVVLRATSAHGPLELEIPISVLEEKSQTIHQLAARKAVQELEEGRGWLHHAKDSSDPEQKLLKEKYEGRFSDMVEREAVRLGVTFQVGSKWCSYVAVEQKDQTEHEVSREAAATPVSQAESEDNDSESEPAHPRGANRFLCSADSPEAEGSHPPPPPPQGTRRKRLASMAARKSAPVSEEVSSPPIYRRGKGRAARRMASSDDEADVVEAYAPPYVAGGLFGAQPKAAAQSLNSYSPPPHAAGKSDSFHDLPDTAFYPDPADSCFDISVPPSPLRSSFGFQSPLDQFEIDAQKMDKCWAAFAYPKHIVASEPMASELIPPGSFYDYDTDYILPPTVAMAQMAPQPLAASMAFGGPLGSSLGIPGQLFGGAAPPPQPYQLQPMQQQQSCPAPGLFGTSVPMQQQSAEPKKATPLEPLDALVQFQNFDGSWAWSNELLDVLGLTRLTSKEGLEERYGVSIPNSDMLATALVLAYMEVKLADDTDEWEMLADKAREWLRSELVGCGQQGLLSVEEYVEKLKAAF
ncbi:von Willebrand factor type A domain-containing protein [Sordaria brevicollis]|uniref:von Willebrand factor type A domain-containing protein n=1 Tax=Sordaria brevicollis TaxID=83679 RepID=A0AAE0UAZ7_SORBR|nr:von Willebrand factor type A domain-containing protein [Sordaria brevicollis]